MSPGSGVTGSELGQAAQLASLADETPEGRSIVVLAKQRLNLREHDLEALHAAFVPFSAQSRMSGVDLPGRELRKGAVDAVRAYVEGNGGRVIQSVNRPADGLWGGGAQAPGGGRKSRGRRER